MSGPAPIIGLAAGAGVGAVLGNKAGRAFGRKITSLIKSKPRLLFEDGARKVTPKFRRTPKFEDITAELGGLAGFYGGAIGGTNLGARFAARGGKSHASSGGRAYAGHAGPSHKTLLKDLGVKNPSNVKTKHDLKKAYRAAAKANHPDKFTDASASVAVRQEAKIKKINNAYDDLRKTRWFDKLAHLMLTKRASKKKLTEKLMEAIKNRSLTEKQKMEIHRFLMPAVAGTAMWGLTGAALAPKGRRKAAFASGLALGAVRPMLWKAIGKGYAKAVRRPFGELIK